LDKRAHAFPSVGGRGDGAEILDRLGNAASVIVGTQERGTMWRRSPGPDRRS
jgi:hypothetical protein